MAARVESAPAGWRPQSRASPRRPSRGTHAASLLLTRSELPLSVAELTVEGPILDPVEPAAQQQIFLLIKALQTQHGWIAGDSASQDEAVLFGLFESQNHRVSRHGPIRQRHRVPAGVHLRIEARDDIGGGANGDAAAGVE